MCYWYGAMVLIINRKTHCCDGFEWSRSTIKKVSIFVRGITKPSHFCVDFISFRCWQCSCEFCCRSRRTYLVLHFPPKTSCFFKLAYSMNSIPLYVMPGTCFFVVFYCLWSIFVSSLEQAFWTCMLTEHLCFNFYSLQVKPVNGTQVRIVDIFLISFYIQDSVGLLTRFTKESFFSFWVR